MPKSRADDDAIAKCMAKIAQIARTLEMLELLIFGFGGDETEGKVWDIISHSWCLNAIGFIFYLRGLPLDFNNTGFTCFVRLSITLWTSTN